MSTHSSFQRHGHYSRSYFPSIASISPTDSGQMYPPSSKEMGPPPLEFPNPSMDIDLPSSRTLPNPSASASPWESNIFQNHGFGDDPYGTTNASKGQRIPVEAHARGPAPDPLLQWYTGNDGPWIPKVIPEVVSGDKTLSRNMGNRNPMNYGGQYRHLNHSDGGSFHYQMAPSDSGYGTRRSVGNTSVFSADVQERDQDRQSLVGHNVDYQSFQPFSELMSTRDGRASDSWNVPVSRSSPPESPGLVCATCHKTVKTQSELKKHDLRHRKPFVCTVPGCPRAEGFSTNNDLERHTKSKHPSAIPESASTKMFRCLVSGCKSREKSWPRLDNFRSHLKRVHSNQLRSDGDIDNMVRRAEFWERSTLDIDQSQSPQGYTVPDISHLVNGPIYENSNCQQFEDTTWSRQLPEPSWKRQLPDVASRAQHLITSTVPYLEPPERNNGIPAQKNALPDIHTQESIQPSAIFKNVSGGFQNTSPTSLQNILLAPAGLESKSSESADKNTLPITKHDVQGKGKLSRSSDVSAADATLTEVIKSALAGASSPGSSTDRIMRQGSHRNELPSGKIQARASWPRISHSTIFNSRSQDGLVNDADSPVSDAESRDMEVEQKALEIVKTIRDLGYIVQKDPSQSPKIQNAGSAASNKSEKKVTCQVCKKFQGRPCELKKHMKRHERPYGCTFLTCSKTFGSKNDWKRHENSQHFHLETWRCDVEKPEGGACAKVCYRRTNFLEHLKKEHQITADDSPQLDEKLAGCRIGRNCQARFWCGFCVKLVELKKKGKEAWTERFDHIDDHFSGRRNLPKQSIQDWIPVDSDKPKGDWDSPELLEAVSGKETDVPSPSGSSDGDSSGVSVAPGASPADAIVLDAGHGEQSKKRKLNNSDEKDCRPTKSGKTSGSYLIYCCECNMVNNSRFTQTCTNCDKTHHFCANCQREPLPVLTEES